MLMINANDFFTNLLVTSQAQLRAKEENKLIVYENTNFTKCNRMRKNLENKKVKNSRRIGKCKQFEL